MTKRRGEIITALTIGAFVVLTAASIISSVFISQNKQTTKSQAEENMKCPGGSCAYCGQGGWWDQGCYFEAGKSQPKSSNFCRCSDVNNCVDYNAVDGYVRTSANTPGSVWCGNDCRIHPGATDHPCGSGTAAGPTLPPALTSTPPPILPPGQPSPTLPPTALVCGNFTCMGVPTGKAYSFKHPPGKNDENTEGFSYKGTGCVGEKMDARALNIFCGIRDLYVTPSPTPYPSPTEDPSKCNEFLCSRLDGSTSPGKKAWMISSPFLQAGQTFNMDTYFSDPTCRNKIVEILVFQRDGQPLLSYCDVPAQATPAPTNHLIPTLTPALPNDCKEERCGNISTNKNYFYDNNAVSPTYHENSCTGPVIQSLTAYCRTAPSPTPASSSTPVPVCTLSPNTFTGTTAYCRSVGSDPGCKYRVCTEDGSRIVVPS